MRIPRLRRLAQACRLVAPTLVAFVFSVVPASADVAGTVVDQSGRPVPRAYVRIVAGSPSGSAAAFADELGRFAIKTSIASCRVDQSTWNSFTDG